jgi:hypothetical protein
MFVHGSVWWEMMSHSHCATISFHMCSSHCDPTSQHVWNTECHKWESACNKMHLGSLYFTLFSITCKCSVCKLYILCDHSAHVCKVFILLSNYNTHEKDCYWSGGLGVACCLKVPKFAGSNLGQSRQDFSGQKILSTPSFRREVKPWVQCRRFAARKRSLNWRGSHNFRQN